MIFSRRWNIRQRSGIGHAKRGTTMAESGGLVVEMIDDQIVVTMPGTFLLASYRKSENAASLVARFIHDDRHAAISRSEFVARSWRLALAKARQLGWIE